MSPCAARPGSGRRWPGNVAMRTPEVADAVICELEGAATTSRQRPNPRRRRSSSSTPDSATWLAPATPQSTAPVLDPHGDVVRAGEQDLGFLVGQRHPQAAAVGLELEPASRNSRWAGSAMRPFDGRAIRSGRIRRARRGGRGRCGSHRCRGAASGHARDGGGGGADGAGDLDVRHAAGVEQPGHGEPVPDRLELGERARVTQEGGGVARGCQHASASQSSSKESGSCSIALPC